MKWFSINSESRLAANTYTAKDDLPVEKEDIHLVGGLPLLRGHVLYCWNTGEYMLVRENSQATDAHIAVNVKREAFLRRKWDASVKRWRNRFGQFCKKHLDCIPAGSQITLWGHAFMENG